VSNLRVGLLVEKVNTISLSHASDGATKATWPQHDIDDELCWRCHCRDDLTTIRCWCRVILEISLPRWLDRSATEMSLTVALWRRALWNGLFRAGEGSSLMKKHYSKWFISHQSSLLARANKETNIKIRKRKKSSMFSCSRRTRTDRPARWQQSWQMKLIQIVPLAPEPELFLSLVDDTPDSETGPAGSHAKWAAAKLCHSCIQRRLRIWMLACVRLGDRSSRKPRQPHGEHQQLWFMTLI
jgi:hypothetical protein